MPKNANAFDDDAAERIARVVRASEVEQVPAGGARTPQGISLPPDPKPRYRPPRGKAERPRRMRVQEEFDNYLSCLTWDGTSEGESLIYVAKPWKLRHTPSNYELITTLTTNQVYEVEVSDSSETEVWRVTPSYEADDEIWIMRSDGGTGLTLGDGSDVIWIDINTDGRAWAVVDEES